MCSIDKGHSNPFPFWNPSFLHQFDFRIVFFLIFTINRSPIFLLCFKTAKIFLFTDKSASSMPIFLPLVVLMLILVWHILFTIIRGDAVTNMASAVS